jgi:hypothetical protein
MAVQPPQLAAVSVLVPTLSITGLFKFIHIAEQLKDDILLAQPAEEPEHEAPEILPPSIIKLLSETCGITLDDVDLLWTELRKLIWHTQDLFPPTLDKIILEHGHDVGLAADTLYPPQHCCIQPTCVRMHKGLCLKKTYFQKVVLYSLDRGAVPAYSVSLYCPGVSWPLSALN